MNKRFYRCDIHFKIYWISVNFAVKYNTSLKLTNNLNNNVEIVKPVLFIIEYL